jgi:hypothetical protein
MKDEKYTPEVGSWLKGREVPHPDSQQTARQVAARLPHVGQRGRWWPLPSFRRLPTTDQTTAYQPSPIPASNSHTPTVIGRTTSMLSPVKAITAGAIVFAIGGAFLIAQPFQQQSSVPGAEAEAAAPTWVTGTVQPAQSCSDWTSVVEIDVIRSRNFECGPQTWTSSDPRLTGEVARRWSEDTYRIGDGAGSKTVSLDAAYLRNEGGGWACSAIDLLDGGSVRSSIALTGTALTCIGNGGYEGLSAILASEYGSGYSEEFVGLIFPGDFPPLPEAPAAE